MQLARRDGGGDQVARACEPMNVGIQAAGAPSALDLQTVLRQRKHQRLDYGVQLRGKTHNVESESRERVVRFGGQDGSEVVDNFHRPRIESCGAWSASHHRHFSAFAAGAQRRAVAGDTAANHHHPAHDLTIRLVSATSRFNCWTRSSTVGKAMSGCRYRRNRSSSRCWYRSPSKWSRNASTRSCVPPKVGR